jgi:hypothetical protein
MVIPEAAKGWLRKADPARVPHINFFYDLRIPVQRFTRAGNHALRVVGLLVEPMSKLFAKLLPKQCNEFAFAISKTGDMQPWIKQGLTAGSTAAD